MKHNYRNMDERFAYRIAQTILDNFIFHGRFYMQQKDIMQKLNMTKQSFYVSCKRKADVIEQVGLTKVKDGKEITWYLDIKKFLNYLIHKYKA